MIEVEVTLLPCTANRIIATQSMPSLGLWLCFKKAIVHSQSITPPSMLGWAQLCTGRLFISINADVTVILKDQVIFLYCVEMSKAFFLISNSILFIVYLPPHSFILSLKTSACCLVQLCFSTQG